MHDQNWANHDEREKKYFWQEGQWCLGGMKRSQKNRELQAQKYNRPRAWRVKQTTDKGKPSAKIDMVFILPTAFRAPSKYEQEESDEEGCDEEELGETVAQLTL